MATRLVAFPTPTVEPFIMLWVPVFLMPLKHAKPLHFVSSMWNSLMPDLHKAASFPLFWPWLCVTSSESQPHPRSSPPHYLSLFFLSSVKITHWLYYCLRPILAWTMLKSRTRLSLPEWCPAPKGHSGECLWAKWLFENHIPFWKLWRQLSSWGMFWKILP